MDILEFLTAGPNMAFLISGCIVVALLIMGIISMVLGMGHDFLSMDGDIDFTADLNGNGIPDYLEVGHGSIMGWMNPGHVPSTIFIILFCGIYSILGYSAQWIYDGVMGSFAPSLLAWPVVMALTLPAVRGTSVAIAPVLPKDETNAITLETLVGSSGVVTSGPITSSDFGFARFTDNYGTSHSILVCGEGEESIANGSPVVLIGPHRERDIAFVVRKI